jgi:hypothetical protein
MFTAKFCPKNETQMALAKLETSSYFQGCHTVDKYINNFQDLIDHTGYTKGLAIMIKFQQGLQRDIQDVITQILTGCPSNLDSEAWYEAALCCAEN